jgi:hypothetical protein
VSRIDSEELGTVVEANGDSGGRATSARLTEANSKPFATSPQRHLTRNQESRSAEREQHQNNPRYRHRLRLLYRWRLGHWS